MPAKSKQQQKFFGVVKAMQKGDIPKKGEAGKVAKDMKKKEVDKMASTKHKGLPKKIKEMIGKSLVKELQLNEVQPFVDNQLRKKWEYPLGDKNGLVYLATDDRRYPTELVVYNIKRDMFHFMHSQMGKWSNPTQENIPADKLPSSHWAQEYFEEWKEDFDYEKGFKENKTVYGLEDPNAKVVNDLTEASANVLRTKYEKAVKKEQALSSLLLINLEKYKAAKAKGDEKAIAKHTKIAGDLGKKKKKATADASAAYKAYEAKISGLHSDAELDLKEDNKKDIRFDLVMSDEAYDELFDLIARYVKDPDDVETELDMYDDGGFDNMSNVVTANLDRDKDYKAWKRKYGIREGKLTEQKMKGKDAGNYIKMAKAGRKLTMNGKTYTCLGKGKWKGPDGKKLSWVQVSSMASALGNKEVVYEGKLTEGRGVMNLIRDAVKELMFDGNISEKEAAMELVTAISDEYKFDAKLKEGINELKIGNKINKARAKAHFKQGENIAVVDKNTGDAIRITNLRQLDVFNSKTHDFAYITEGINEALPKFKTPYEAFSWIMNKRGDAMEIEDEMRDVSKDIQQTYRKMEQEAEPEGGAIASRYSEELESLEMHHKQLRAEFQKVMAEIDEYDQNY